MREWYEWFACYVNEVEVSDVKKEEEEAFVVVVGEFWRISEFCLCWGIMKLFSDVF